jgi:hypothetical protein
MEWILIGASTAVTLVAIAVIFAVAAAGPGGAPR